MTTRLDDYPMELECSASIENLAADNGTGICGEMKPDAYCASTSIP